MARKIIQPQPAPRAATKKVVPQKVLKEFGDILNLKPVPARGPAVLRAKCMASWEVTHSDEDILAYLEVAEQIGNCQRLFHGTPARNLESITMSGLMVGGSHCMFGAGIYFGNIGKTFGYTHKRGYSAGKRWKRDDNPQQAHYILEAEVALGKVLVATAPQRYSLSALAAMGHHSVQGKAGLTSSWGGTLAYDEWVVYRPSQVYLKYIHEYQLTQEAQAVPQPHLCECLIETVPITTKGNKAWLDVLSKPRACGRNTYTRLDTTGGEVWVCETCLQSKQLLTGDRLLILRKNGPETVRLKG